MKTIFFLLFTTCSCLATAQSQDTISVYFENGTHTLNSRSRQMLDSLTYYNVLEPVRPYTVIGYADIVGGEAPNNTLSAKRAKAVAEYIGGLGIATDTIFGAGEVAKPEQKEGYPEDRRVDIIAMAKPKLPDIKTLKKGDVFDLENMFFYGGQAVMKPESEPVLKLLLTIMKQHINLKVRIEGHVHCTTGNSNFQTRFVSPTGDKTIEGRRQDQYSQQAYYAELSTARAKMVRDYLVKNNIDSTRLQYAGLACKEMNLHPDNNRRVSIRILEK